MRRCFKMSVCIKKRLSDQCLEFIGKCLVTDPKERMTSQECEDHPWLQGGSWLQLPETLTYKRVDPLVDINSKSRLKAQELIEYLKLYVAVGSIGDVEANVERVVITINELCACVITDNFQDNQKVIARKLLDLVKVITSNALYESIRNEENVNCGRFWGSQDVATTMEDVKEYVNVMDNWWRTDGRTDSWWKRHFTSIGITIERLLRGGPSLHKYDKE